MISKELIFISSPYSTNNGWIKKIRLKQTKKYVAKLLLEGKFPFSPVIHGHYVAIENEVPTDWKFWKDYCICFIEKCEEVHILMLEGWEESEGVKQEIEIAKLLNKKIIYIKKEEIE